ncbi:MAG: DUF2341 domain-containing protein [Candidatus Parvarchaeota archaeon]|nr:DUF2341 domain-containing protein [Candidatus Parvarchaeota archaeon]
MSLPLRSQSALEYMMTYGWAILVIVIVAAVLYSLGIFSPSSSLSTTVTGFANTPVSSAAFTNNGGLAFSVGDLVGYPIEITNVTEITASGSKITILPNITVSPSQTKVIIIPKAFSSSTQGSHESVSLTITYTEPGQVFPGPYTSTGTVSGTTPTLFFPTNQTFAAVSKLTITNSQTTATPSPFQQMINITSTSPGWAYISQDFGQNVEFFYPNGTVIPSWLENYTSSHALWWVKVGSIPASSSITIYMGFASSSTNLFNNKTTGEATQLSSTYAGYDNGANVFYVYFNANTSLSSFTQYDVSTLSQTTLNSEPVISFSANSAYGWAGFSNPIPLSFIIDGWIYTTQTTSMVGFVGQAQTSSDSGYLFGGGTGAGDTYVSITMSNSDALTGLADTGPENENSWEYVQVSYNDGDIIISGGNAPQSFSYTASASDTTYTSGYVGIGESGFSGYNYYRYMFVRAYPPNGVMPSVTFGSVS